MISQLLDISCVLRGSRPLHPSNQKLNQKLSPYWSGGDWVPKWDGQVVFRPTRNCGPLGQDKHMEGVQCATAMDAQRLTDHAHCVIVCVVV